MKHAIIAAIGPAGHGKTTLLQALTGATPVSEDPFYGNPLVPILERATLTLPDGTITDLIEWPFALPLPEEQCGIDVALLVIAADTGPAQDTEEFLNTLAGLPVKYGVVALTKCDLVTKEQTDTVEQYLRKRVQETVFIGSPFFRIHTPTGRGIAPLKRELQSNVSRSAPREAALPFCLPILQTNVYPDNRTIVVSGPLLTGTLRQGDLAEIASEAGAARILRLETLGQRVQEAEAGTYIYGELAVESGAQAVILPGTSLSAPGLITSSGTIKALLQPASAGTSSSTAMNMALLRSPVGLTYGELEALAALPEASFTAELEAFLTSATLHRLSADYFIHAVPLALLTERVRYLLEAYHARFPFRAGMERHALRAALQPIQSRELLTPAIFTEFLHFWQAIKIIQADSETVRLLTFQIALSKKQQTLLSRMEEIYRESDVFPPTIKQLNRELQAAEPAVQTVLNASIERGLIVHIKEEIYLHRDTVERLKKILIENCAERGAITVGTFRDLSKSNREMAVLILEYFDQTNFTERYDNERRLKS